jgi:hypothetical protein
MLTMLFDPAHAKMGGLALEIVDNVRLIDRLDLDCELAFFGCRVAEVVV